MAPGARLRSWAGRARRKLWPGRFVLMYHRVAEPAHDPSGLAVSPGRFDEQLRALRAWGPVLPLGRMLRELDAGTLPDRAAAVTFDDGYADTLLAALPLLRRHDVPATVFLCPGLLDGRTSFWWDALARIVFAPEALPPRLQTRIGGAPVAWTAAADGPASAAERHALHATLRPPLKRMAHEARRAALAELAAWAGLDALDDADARPMSEDEAARLAADGLVEIGAHSMTHPSLPGCPPRRRRVEIETSKARCEQIAGAPVHAFSYPFGAHCRETRRHVREAGFASACVTAAGPLDAATDRFRLPRVPALGWDGADLERRLAARDFA